MHCLFFDVLPKPGHMPHYFEHVARLKPVLARHEGLIFLDRYRPLDQPEALLSHQLWRDEAAITAWRSDETHRVSQAAGRRIHFESYRIRVGPQVAEHPGGMADQPDGAGRFLVAAYGAAPADLPGGRSFESVNHEGRFLTLVTADLGAAARETALRASDGGAETVRIFVVTRDYTMTDRAEAPQPGV
jgi:heme-degrading monooxygenase HmoA